MTCANCKHNDKIHDICWMWGCPPDNKGTVDLAERCQYYEPVQETQDEVKHEDK